MKFKLKQNIILICIVTLLTAALFGTGGCGGGSSLPATPKEIEPGSEYEGTLSFNDNGEETILMSTRYEAHNIETSASLPPAVALFVTEEKYLDETSGKLKASSNTSFITENDVETFLKNTWDPFYDGKDDEGVNAREFLDFLTEYNMPMDQFFRFLEATGGSVGELDNIVKVYSSQLEELDGKDVFNEIESFCDLTGIELETYFTDIKETFTTYSVFCSKLVELGTGQSGLYSSYVDWYMEQETELADPFGSFLSYLKNKSNNAKNGENKIDPVEIGKLGLEIMKFGWDVIKDGKPQLSADGAFTSVLRKDTSGLDYGYTKTNKTGTIEFKVTDAWIKSWVLIDAKMKGVASYAATNPNFGGQYLPNVQLDVESAYLIWGMNLNVNAQVSNVINVSSVDNPDPVIDVIAKVNAGWLFQSFKESAYFKVQGSKGISFEGWK